MEGLGTSRMFIDKPIVVSYNQEVQEQIYMLFHRPIRMCLFFRNPGIADPVNNPFI